MPDPFSLGTVRKGSAEPLRKEENRAVARFSEPSAGLEPATPSLPSKSGRVCGRGAESQSPCLRAGIRFRHPAAFIGAFRHPPVPRGYLDHSRGAAHALRPSAVNPALRAPPSAARRPRRTQAPLPRRSRGGPRPPPSFGEPRAGAARAAVRRPRPAPIGALARNCQAPHSAASSSSRSSSSSASDGTHCHCETRQVTASSSRWSGSRTVPGGARSVRHRSTRQETHDASGLPSGRSDRSARSRCPRACRTRARPALAARTPRAADPKGAQFKRATAPGVHHRPCGSRWPLQEGGNRTPMCTGSGAVESQ